MAQVTLVERADDADVARWLEDRLARALADRAGTPAICVPGGTTPFPILERLAGAPPDWPRVTIWPGDDRVVPESHPASNVGRMRALLAPTGARIVSLAENAVPPHFSLVWLGMGPDGHVASLFPNTDPRADDARRVRRTTPDPLPPEAPFDRLTLTIPALLDCDELAFVIRGEGKRALFAAALRGDNDLPVARLLRAACQPVTCFA